MCLRTGRSGLYSGWLRYSVHRWDGLATSLLIGAALGLNWPCQVELYNFLVGVHSNPVTRLNSVVAIGKDIIVWDNYETGYYLFPLIAAGADARRFIREISSINMFHLRYSEENFEDRLLKLTALIGTGSDKIDTLIVWAGEVVSNQCSKDGLNPRCILRAGG